MFSPSSSPEVFKRTPSEQDTIVELIHTTIRAVSEMLARSPGLPEHEREVLIERARGLMADIRQAEGTIHNPEIWQEIHSLADAVQARLDRI